MMKRPVGHSAVRAVCRVRIGRTASVVRAGWNVNVARMSRRNVSVGGRRVVVSSNARVDRLRRLAILGNTSSRGLSRWLVDLSNETGLGLLSGPSRLGRLLSDEDLDDLVVGHLGLSYADDARRAIGRSRLRRLLSVRDLGLGVGHLGLSYVHDDRLWDDRTANENL